MAKTATGKKRLITIGNKRYDGVRTIVREVIKRAGLQSFTYEDVILAADGPLEKFAPYLEDQIVKRSLWAMNDKKEIKRCGSRGNLAVYKESSVKQEPEKTEQAETPSVKNSNEITASDLGEQIIRYIGILKTNINKLESELSNERHLHGKALSALKDKQVRCDQLEKINRDLQERVVAMHKFNREKASETTFKLSELAKIS